MNRLSRLAFMNRVTGKAAKDVAEGTKSFVRGLKKGFGKKDEDKKE